MSAKVVALVQARMGSHRLPGKMMLPFRGAPIIEWVFRRTQKARLLSQIVFAIPDTSENDVLSDFLSKLGAVVFRGSETDVLARFYHAAREHSADLIVRICADNPLVSGEEVDRLATFFSRENHDYAYNHIPRGNAYPDGLGAEMVSFELLETLHQKAVKPEHREHVFQYVWDAAENYRIGTFDPADPALRHPELKLDIDTIQDHERLSRIPFNIEMNAVETVAAALAHTNASEVK